MESFSIRLKRVLYALGLTPAEFAEKTQISKSSMSHLMSGRNKPSIDMIDKMMDAFPLLNPMWIISGVKPVLFKPDEIPTIKDSQSISKMNQEVYKYPSLTDESALSNARTDQAQSILDSSKIDNKEIAAAQQHEELKIKSIVIFYEDGTFASFKPTQL